jgi:dienelactone hydrolase
MKLVSVLLLTPLLCGLIQGAVVTKTIEYADGPTVLEGYLAYDDSLKPPRPGVLIVHEWTGLGSYVKGRAEQLAKLGYIAFAVDIYGKGIRPQNTEEAAAQAGIYRQDRSLMRRRITAGLDWLRQNSLVDPNRIAAIGYCFGGGVVMELARSGASVAGVVSFHGNLDTPHPEDARNIKAKVLVLHGADDPYVGPEQVTAFEKEMREAGVDWQMVVYGGAVHSFTNPASGNDPAKGAAYNAVADRRSWDEMKRFFKEIFGE